MQIITKKPIISADEIYLTIRVEWAVDHFGLSLTYIDPLVTKICARNDFYFFVPSDLDLWPLDRKFTPLVNLVQRAMFLVNQ